MSASVLSSNRLIFPPPQALFTRMSTRSPPILGPFDHRQHVGLVRAVGTDAHRVGPELLLELLRDRCTLGLVDLGDQHVGTLGREPAGDAAADAVPGARDHGNALVETSHALYLPLSSTNLCHVSHRSGRVPRPSWWSGQFAACNPSGLTPTSAPYQSSCNRRTKYQCSPRRS